MSNKWGIGLAIIEDFADASKQRFNVYIQKRKYILIQQFIAAEAT